ncbi:MAG: hypothetical protein IKW78_08560, partial [Prevotella sp.]|nr:hypothetical protein [Prevotella sp.]
MDLRRQIKMMLVLTILILVGGTSFAQTNVSKSTGNSSKNASKSSENSSKNDSETTGKTQKIAEQPIIDDDEVIPDSLLNTRWKIQRTTPITYDDLNQNPADLKRPENMKQQVEYNDTLDRYVIGSKIGNQWIA